MAHPDDGHLQGVPLSYSWAATPLLDDVTNVERFAAMTGWGQIYAEAEASEPTNVRVEVHNMRGYIFSKSKRTWILVQPEDLALTGGHWRDDFRAKSASADIRHEPDGGISVTMVPGYNFHFFPTSRGPIPVGDTEAFYVTYEARLILDTPSGPNNLTIAKFLANAGADLWRHRTGGSTGNRGVGQGRFTFLTSQYQHEDFYSGGPYGVGIAGAWTEAQLRANPPPL